MSLLLDALNKADQERKRSGESPSIGSNHESTYPLARNSGRRFILLSLSGLLLLGLLISVYWLGKQNHTAESAVVSIEKNTAPTQAANPPAIAAPVQQPSSVASEMPSRETTPSLAEANEEENIASLYQQQATDSVAIPDTAPATEVTETLPPPAPSTSPMSLAQFANLPDIQDLPNSVLVRIPSLKYSEHNFNNNGGSVVINGLVRHANEQVTEGLVIDKILEDGIILHFETYSFKMRAMNNWVNM
ncbi:MAG TPA: general secretion pathway protein GspB [Cellvibrio sp.]|nr:general secretion pathway protein GspB [Cellvibrio sp.]